MPVSTMAVGAALNPVVTEMTTRRLLAFAAGIEESSELLLDDTNPGFHAAPQICVALEWALMLNNDSPEDIGLSREEALRALHALQDTEFLCPVKPGERLTTQGEIVAIWPGRSGTNMAYTLVTSGENGAPVSRTHMQSTFLAVAMDGEPFPLDPKPAVPKIEESLADSHEFKIPIARTLPHIFSECADIWNPIHTERAVAKSAGLPDIILHGVATWSIAGRELTHRLGGGDTRKLKRLRGRMGAMVRPGTMLTLKAKSVLDGTTRRVTFSILTPQGEPAIRDGYAEFTDQ
ncbi:MAG: MaoC/PaaZ C-terminal domain-containing protein [Pseudomonadota bacterium]